MKKIISAILCITLSLALLPTAVAADGTDYEIKITSCKYDIVKQAITATARITNNTASDKFAVMYSALYSGDRLVVVQRGAVYIPSDDVETVDITIARKLSGCTLKVFLLENNTSISPICENAVCDEEAVYEITSMQLEGVEASANGEFVKLTYRENPSDRYVQSYQIDAKASAYLNGVKKDIANADALVRLLWRWEDVNFYGTVTLSNTGGQGQYDFDTLHISDYETIVVEANNINTGRLTSYNSSSLQYANIENTIDATLYGVDGAEMKWTDLKEWDVVSYISTRSQGTVITAITGWVIDNSIKGKVSSITNNETIIIAGEEYGFDRNFNFTDIGLGDEGTFYLDILGNISHFEREGFGTGGKYGYLQRVAGRMDFDKVIQMRIYTQDGTMITADAAPEIRIDGVSIESRNMLDNDLNIKDAPPRSATRYTSSLNTQHGDDHYLAADGVNAPSIDSNIYYVKGLQAGELIIYQTNGSGQIATIDRAYATTNTDFRTSFTKFGGAIRTTFDARNNSLTTDSGTRLYLTDKTFIIGFNPIGTSNFELHSLASFFDNNKLVSVTYYNVNADRDIGAMTFDVTNASTVIGDDSLFLATQNSGVTINTEGDSVQSVTGYRYGELKNFTGQKGWINGVVQGVPYTLALTAGNLIRGANPLVNEYFATSRYVSLSSSAMAQNATLYSKIRYCAGEVEEFEKRLITFVGGDEVEIDSGVNIYLYDERLASRSRVTNYGDITAYDKYGGVWDDGGQMISHIYAFTREYEGRATDVIIYVFR